MKINVYSVFVKLMLLNAFVSLTARIYPSSIPLGKIIGALIILILCSIYYRTLDSDDVCFLIILILFSILPIINSTNMRETSEHVINFLVCMMILWKSTNYIFREKLLQALYRHKKQILLNIKMSIIILMISCFLASSYIIASGEKAFIGLSTSNHILCGTICFYMTLLLVYLNNEKIKIIHLGYFAVYILAILMSGARTYLIMPLCILIILYKLKLKKSYSKYIILPISFIFIRYAFFNSSSYSRFIAQTQNKYISSNILEAITSGRTIWWKIDINQYKTFPIIEKMFGAGYSIVYQINETFYNMRIWAHNDFIQLLLGIGFLGLGFYIFVLIRFFCKVRKYGKVKNIKFPILIIISSFIVNATFNGYYGNLRLVVSTVFISLLIFNNGMYIKYGGKNE